MKTLGKPAFSLTHSSQRDALEMCAELLTGAQEGRNDRLIFSRKTQLLTSVGVFKGSLKVILNPGLVNQYLETLEHIGGEAKLPGAFATLASGKLRIHFPTTTKDRRTWILARSGNRYIVANLWLGVEENGSLSAAIPRGREAFLTASLICEKAKPS